MCGRRFDDKPDLVVMDEDDFILLVQQRYNSSAEAEPQLIAEAIAAFYENNIRRRDLGLATVPNQVFAGIVMSGTGPAFYKILVSEGPHPRRSTVSPEYNCRQQTANRRVVFQCLETFKQLMLLPTKPHL
ncbi:hypothetical protein B0H10DRAFT_2207452 [Mycena sp. CBHHK59/15]|nr:hypothetical protein B0H10DRAFT_2207452 [Mycena sp. CBHHK59/15]